MKDRDAARRHAAPAAEHFQEQLNFEPKNNQFRLMVVESLARSGQFDKAESTLRAAQGTADDERFPEALVGVYVMQSDFAMRQSPPQLHQAFVSLQTAIATKAEHPSVWKRLSAIALRSDNGQRADIQEMLKAHLTQGARRQPCIYSSELWPL